MLCTPQQKVMNSTKHVMMSSSSQDGLCSQTSSMVRLMQILTSRVYGRDNMYLNQKIGTRDTWPTHCNVNKYWRHPCKWAAFDQNKKDKGKSTPPTGSHNGYINLSFVFRTVSNRAVSGRSYGSVDSHLVAGQSATEEIEYLTSSARAERSISLQPLLGHPALHYATHATELSTC